MSPPLSELTISRTIGLYGEFTGPEFDAVVAASRDVSAPNSVVGHLLALSEQPHLVMLEREGKAGSNMAAYRSAVCLGATMLRRQAHENGKDFSGVTVNPARRYLYFADMAIDGAYHTYQRWPVIGEDFTKPEYFACFFEDQASAERVKGLQQRLVQNHISFMTELGPTREKEMFSFFCRGLLDMFALYGRAEWKTEVAPTGEVFDREKHVPLNSRPEWARQEAGDPNLRWRMGSLASSYLGAGSEVQFDQIGTTRLQPGHRALKLFRGIGGFVRASDFSDSSIIPVSFPLSTEVFDLSDPNIENLYEKDVLITRGYQSGANVFGKLRSPFIADNASFSTGGREIVGLCRKGVAYFAYEPHLNLRTEESALAAVLFRTEV